MKELIDLHQAQMLMIGVLVAAPLIGLLVGAVQRKAVRGFLLGLTVGVGNLALWTIYNAITNRLGLDTVKNLLVNLALFAVVGIAAGAAIAWWSMRSQNDNRA